MTQSIEQDAKDLILQIERDKAALKQAFSELRTAAAQKVDLQEITKKAPLTWIVIGFRVGFFLGRIL